MSKYKIKILYLSKYKLFYVSNELELLFLYAKNISIQYFTRQNFKDFLPLFRTL